MSTADHDYPNLAAYAVGRRGAVASHVYAEAVAALAEIDRLRAELAEVEATLGPKVPTELQGYTA